MDLIECHRCEKEETKDNAVADGWDWFDQTTAICPECTKYEDVPHYDC